MVRFVDYPGWEQAWIVDVSLSALHHILGPIALQDVIDQCDIITGAALDTNDLPHVNSNIGEDMQPYYNLRAHCVDARDYIRSDDDEDPLLFDIDNDGVEFDYSDDDSDDEEPPSQRLTTRLSHKQSLPQTRSRTATY